MTRAEVVALAKRLERYTLLPFAGSYHDADFVFEVDDAALRDLAPAALAAALLHDGASARARERALDGLVLHADLARIELGFDLRDASTRAYAWTSAMKVLGSPGLAHWGVRAGGIRARRLSALVAIRAAARDEVARMFADLRAGAADHWRAPVGRDVEPMKTLENRMFHAPDDPPRLDELAALSSAARAQFGAFAMLLLEREEPRGPRLALAYGLPGARAALEDLQATATGPFGEAVRVALAG